MIHSQLPDDDPRDEAIKETLTNCAEFLGAEFQQFMPLLRDQLIKDANLSLDFKMTSVEDATPDDNQAMRVKIQGFGEQKISMKTEALVRKTTALHVIQHCSIRMGKAFAPFVQDFFPIVKELLSYSFNKKVRSYAVKCFVAMLGSASEPLNTQMF